jgi:hypothetical protein
VRVVNCWEVDCRVGLGVGSRLLGSQSRGPFPLPTPCHQPSPCAAPPSPCRLGSRCIPRGSRRRWSWRRRSLGRGCRPPCAALCADGSSLYPPEEGSWKCEKLFPLFFCLTQRTHSKKEYFCCVGAGLGGGLLVARHTTILPECGVRGKVSARRTLHSSDKNVYGVRCSPSNDEGKANDDELLTSGGENFADRVRPKIM